MLLSKKRRYMMSKKMFTTNTYVRRTITFTTAQIELKILVMLKYALAWGVARSKIPSSSGVPESGEPQKNLLNISVLSRGGVFTKSS